MVFSYHESIGTYPTRLLYGDKISPNRGLITEWSERDNLKNITYSDYIKQLNEQLRNIVRASQLHQEEVNRKKIEKSPLVPSKFSIGQYVLVAYPNKPPDKLMTKWRGPYIIVNIENQTYFCKDLINNKIIPLFIDM